MKNKLNKLLFEEDLLYKRGKDRVFFWKEDNIIVTGLSLMINHQAEEEIKVKVIRPDIWIYYN